MNNTLIVTGGSISKKIVEHVFERQNFETIIAVDGGLKYIDEMHIQPNIIVGDFDTINPEILHKYEHQKDIILKRFDPVKDFTDTESAMKVAVEIGSEEITILGGTGTRLDHTIANIQLLQIPLKKHIRTCIINDNNKIVLLDAESGIEVLPKNEKYKYLSLIPLTEIVKGVTIEGVKYPLNKTTFYLNERISLGVSNEIISSEATVSVDQGILIVIQSCD